MCLKSVTEIASYCVTKRVWSYINNPVGSLLANVLNLGENDEQFLFSSGGRFQRCVLVNTP